MSAPSTARELIDWWLDHINETDGEARREVIRACEDDKELRIFYVDLAKKAWTEYSETNILNKQYQFGAANGNQN